MESIDPPPTPKDDILVVISAEVPQLHCSRKVCQRFCPLIGPPGHLQPQGQESGIRLGALCTVCIAHRPDSQPVYCLYYLREAALVHPLHDSYRSL